MLGLSETTSSVQSVTTIWPSATGTCVVIHATNSAASSSSPSTPRPPPGVSMSTKSVRPPVAATDRESGHARRGVPSVQVGRYGRLRALVGDPEVRTWSISPLCTSGRTAMSRSWPSAPGTHCGSSRRAWTARCSRALEPGERCFTSEPDPGRAPHIELADRLTSGRSAAGADPRRGGGRPPALRTWIDELCRLSTGPRISLRRCPLRCAGVLVPVER